MSRSNGFELAQTMLQHFKNQPCVVESEFGPILGVLTEAHIGIHGRWILIVRAHGISGWWVIYDFYALKTAREGS